MKPFTVMTYDGTLRVEGPLEQPRMSWTPTMGSRESLWLPPSAREDWGRSAFRDATLSMRLDVLEENLRSLAMAMQPGIHPGRVY